MLVVWKLDRLSRNLVHLVKTAQSLSGRGIGLRVLAGQGAQIDTTTAAGRLVFGIFAALVEFEQELIRERTVAGLKAARAQGRQEVRAIKSLGTAGSARYCEPRHLGVGALRGDRHQASNALQVRGACGPTANNGLYEEGVCDHAGVVEALLAAGRIHMQETTTAALLSTALAYTLTHLATSQ